MRTIDNKSENLIPAIKTAYVKKDFRSNTNILVVKTDIENTSDTYKLFEELGTLTKKAKAQSGTLEYVDITIQ